MFTKDAQARLNQQLRYEQALAGCSRSLLLAADGEDSQQRVLNQALEHLRAGAQASRAYILRNFDDTELGPCTGILAEVCALGIPPQINNPANQRFPLSRFPSEMVNALADGKSYGGPVKQVLASTPQMLEIFLSQRNPLLSFICFPILDQDRWWGFVGFDDCITEREWDKREISLLHIASEMIGSTLQRWEAKEHLRETLSSLEQRVQERTIEFARANADLRHEIHERQRFQNELEERLNIETTMAKISARLLSPMELKSAIQETIADLGLIMRADRVAYIQLTAKSTDTIGIATEWNAPETTLLPNNLERHLNTNYSWFRNQLDGNKSVFIDDLSILPESAQAERELLNEGDVDSLLLIPIIIDYHLAGVIACRNPDLPKSKISDNIQSVEVVASMLSSLLNREALLNTLEQKVAERTRELSAFFDMTMLAGEIQEISDIMQPALVKVMEISASEAAIIHLYAEDQRTLEIVAQRGFPTEILTQLQSIYLDESTIAWIEGIGTGDDFDSAITIAAPEQFTLPGFHSASHTLLRARGKVQGLLSCYRLAEIPFNPYQAYFLSAIGEQLGIAVENYRLRLRAEEIATIQERQRLARELHDAVSQSLYSLTLFARSGRDALESGDQAKLSDSLQQLETNSLVALKEMRLLLYQLRSLALQEGGLVRAIESRFDLVERRLGVQTNIHVDEKVVLSGRVEQELFRLTTEALNNVLRHAGASQVSVSISSDNEQVVLEVSDNGQGFNPSQATAGMGLQNMRERASALGGRFEISSNPDHGTRIRVEIPQIAVSLRVA